MVSFFSTFVSINRLACPYPKTFNPRTVGYLCRYEQETDKKDVKCPHLSLRHSFWCASLTNKALVYLFFAHNTTSGFSASSRQNCVKQVEEEIQRCVWRLLPSSMQSYSNFIHNRCHASFHPMASVKTAQRICCKSFIIMALVSCFMKTFRLIFDTSVAMITSGISRVVMHRAYRLGFVIVPYSLITSPRLHTNKSLYGCTRGGLDSDGLISHDNAGRIALQSYQTLVGACHDSVPWSLL